VKVYHVAKEKKSLRFQRSPGYAGEKGGERHAIERSLTFLEKDGLAWMNLLEQLVKRQNDNPIATYWGSVWATIGLLRTIGD